MNGDQSHAFLFRRDAPANLTPSAPAFCRVAVGVRLSLRVTTLVFVFSRTMLFSVRMSSLVHGLGFFVFFAIGRFISGIPWPHLAHFCAGRLRGLAVMRYSADFPWQCVHALRADF